MLLFCIFLNTNINRYIHIYERIFSIVYPLI